MSNNPPVPLCVDLDETLTASDTLYECLAGLLRTRPIDAFLLPVWLIRGKVEVKQQLVRRVDFDPKALPYRTDLLNWIRDEARSRPVFLVTAAHRTIAERVAEHLGTFSGVIATEEINLAGETKADALRRRFGDSGYDYVGNSLDDVPAWRNAREAIMVAASPRTSARAKASNPSSKLFQCEPERSKWAVWAQALRLYQWVKNLLLLLAPLAAHRLQDPAVAAGALTALLTFGMAASAGYLINDLLDLPADREHARKRMRPIASGALSARSAFIGAGLLCVASLALSAALSLQFALFVALYLILGQVYSCWLKRKVLVDVMLLAGLYTLRVVAGAAAVDVPVSFWLLALCAYGFLSLALLKRYAELVDASVQEVRTFPAPHRGYVGQDLPVVLVFGVGSGIAASLVMALYVDSQASGNLYSRPELLWILVGLLLLGIARLWLTAGRGQMHDDPILHVFRDPVSLVLAAIGLLTALASI